MACEPGFQNVKLARNFSASTAMKGKFSGFKMKTCNLFEYNLNAKISQTFLWDKIKRYVLSNYICSIFSGLVYYAWKGISFIDHTGLVTSSGSLFMIISKCDT